jgi:phosphoserine phosphatase RsbU/P
VLLHHDTDRFATVALLRARRRDAAWHVTIALGGHPLPLLRRGAGALVEAGRSGLLLGVFDDPQLPEAEVEMTRGDVLVLYTDGATEARDDRESFFGEDGLAAAVMASDGSAQQRAESIAGEILDFQNQDARDDLALVVLRVP